MLKGLKSVDRKIIQMYHFRHINDIRYAQIGGTPNFFWSGTLTFSSGTDGSPELLFSKS